MNSTIPSPCIGVCQMDAERRYCVGCVRTLDEIARWSTASDAERSTILAAVQQRPGFTKDDVNE